jgi:hypothetical protein
MPGLGLTDQPLLRVDRERREVVDVLSNLAPGGAALWMCQHPGLKIVSRDRRGARQAGSVADRFH